METLSCTSCSKSVSTTIVARFSCPADGKYEIVRCRDCRVNAVQYECPDCNFKGPN